MTESTESYPTSTDGEVRYERNRRNMHPHMARSLYSDEPVPDEDDSDYLVPAPAQQENVDELTEEDIARILSKPLSQKLLELLAEEGYVDIVNPTTVLTLTNSSKDGMPSLIEMSAVDDDKLGVVFDVLINDEKIGTVDFSEEGASDKFLSLIRVPIGEGDADEESDQDEDSDEVAQSFLQEGVEDDNSDFVYSPPTMR